MEEHENSLKSTQSGKQRTSAIDRLTPGEALEILQQAAVNCQKKGFTVRAVSLYGASVPSVALVIENVELINGNLTAINGSLEGS